MEDGWREVRQDGERIYSGRVIDLDAELARLWTDVQNQSPDERAETFQINRKPGSRRGSRRRRRRSKARQPS